MTLVVRSVLGAALILTGASAAMAQSVAGQSPQTGASTATAASNTAPAAYRSPQTGAYTATTASNTAPVAGQYQKSYTNGLPDDKADRYGGKDPNTTAGSRAFWDSMNPY